MIGLSYLLFFLLYLAVAVLVVWLAAKKARNRGISGWKWGVPAALVMYLLVFWDWIPTVVMHDYYCSEYAGLKVYKTPEAWKQENPGVAETLHWSDESDRSSADGKIVYVLNERFSWIIDWDRLPLSMAKKSERIVDTKTGETVVEELDVSAAMHSIGVGIRSIRDLKFWLQPYGTCFKRSERERWLFERNSFSDLMSKYKRIKGDKDVK